MWWLCANCNPYLLERFWFLSSWSIYPGSVECVPHIQCVDYIPSVTSVIKSYMPMSLNFQRFLFSVFQRANTPLFSPWSKGTLLWPFKNKTQRICGRHHKAFIPSCPAIMPHHLWTYGKICLGCALSPFPSAEKEVCMARSDGQDRFHLSISATSGSWWDIDDDVVLFRHWLNFSLHWSSYYTGCK